VAGVGDRFDASVRAVPASSEEGAALPVVGTSLAAIVYRVLDMQGAENLSVEASRP
jgi:hypothetical protein